MLESSAPPVARAALKGLCPRCGSGTLFARLTAFAPKCRACSLDFASFNVGDGPAAFLVLIVGALITGIAIAVELSLKPPFWIYFVVLPPITFLGVLMSLRVAKAGLLALEYKNGASEGGIQQ